MAQSKGREHGGKASLFGRGSRWRGGGCPSCYYTTSGRGIAIPNPRGFDAPAPSGGAKRFFAGKKRENFIHGKMHKIVNRLLPFAALSLKSAFFRRNNLTPDRRKGIIKYNIWCTGLWRKCRRPGVRSRKLQEAASKNARMFFRLQAAGDGPSASTYIHSIFRKGE